MAALLFFFSVVFGVLSFFEPCTIATHTLFSARINGGSLNYRLRAIFQLIIFRFILLMTIFWFAAVIGLNDLSSNGAILIVSGIGAVYLISRKLYIPVPHLELYRLYPHQNRLPQSIKLGLTLPACTLPLVFIVSLLSALAHNPYLAVIAGFIFAFMFSLPTIWASAYGLNTHYRLFLGQAAAASPYITVALLWGSALFIWMRF